MLFLVPALIDMQIWDLFECLLHVCLVEIAIDEGSESLGAVAFGLVEHAVVGG
jgi:hypothetical protein